MQPIQKMVINITKQKKPRICTYRIGKMMTKNDAAHPKGATAVQFYDNEPHYY